MDLTIEPPPLPSTSRTVQLVDLEPDIEEMIDAQLGITPSTSASGSVACHEQDPGQDEDYLQLCVEDEEMDDFLLLPPLLNHWTTFLFMCVIQPWKFLKQPLSQCKPLPSSQTQA